MTSKQASENFKKAYADYKRRTGTDQRPETLAAQAWKKAMKNGRIK
jgi:hypothetical protein